MGPACRLGKAIIGGALQDKFDGMVYVNPVPRRNIQGGDLRAGAHHGADHLIASALIEERHPVSALRSRLDVLSVKPGLGDSDGGAFQPQPHLGGNSNAAWLCDALPVELEFKLR